MARRRLVRSAAAGTAPASLELRLRLGPDAEGRSIRHLTLIDEFTRQYLAIRVARRINAFGVIETFADAMLRHGIPGYIRSDNRAA